jgi:hypothetical protein
MQNLGIGEALNTKERNTVPKVGKTKLGDYETVSKRF